MGPVRGGLILTFIASSAMAEVCDKERPFWDRTSGPASMFDELIALSLNPPSMVLLGLSIITFALKLRALQWALAPLWLLAAVVAVANYYGPILDDVRWEAIGEGCIGSPLLFVGLAIAICATLIHGARRLRN